MRHDVFESKMREMECFSFLRLLPHTWIIVRVDGQGFSRLTGRHFEKPFDARFHDLMIITARALLEYLQGIYAWTQSDEISVLLRPDWQMLDRRLEKTVSLSASIAGAAFTYAAGIRAHFDGRVWLGTERALVADYFRWRQSDGERCALNSWCYWLLRKDGQSAAQATAALNSKPLEFKYELMLRHGVNFKETPAWQRRGSGVYWTEYQKEGYNPKKQQKLVVTRRRLQNDDELPIREAYVQLIHRLMDKGAYTAIL